MATRLKQKEADTEAEVEQVHMSRDVRNARAS